MVLNLHNLLWFEKIISVQYITKYFSITHAYTRKNMLDLCLFYIYNFINQNEQEQLWKKISNPVKSLKNLLKKQFGRNELLASHGLPRQTFFIITLLCLILVSCSSKVEEEKYGEQPGNITFIAEIDDPEAELVVKNVIRNSIIEDKYTLLKQHDTLIFPTDGKTFFMVGIRSTVLDTLVIDDGDVVTVKLSNDTLSFQTNKSDLEANKTWMNGFYSLVEDEYLKIFETLSRIPENIESLKKPLLFTNDYEDVKSHISRIYTLDRDAYNKNRIHYDQLVISKFNALDSTIKFSTIDPGSKRILREAIFTSTVDKFSRLASVSLQNWMYDKMIKELQEDCNSNYTTTEIMSLVNFGTGKTHQKITIQDLEKYYLDTDKIDCPELQKEVKRANVLRMFQNLNNDEVSKKYLDDYMEDSKELKKDSIFYRLIEEEFGINEVLVFYGRDKNPVLNLSDEEVFFEEIIAANKGKVIVVDFWASWCKPCRESFPDMKALEEKYKDEDFKTIYISIDEYPNPWKRAVKVDGLLTENSYWVPNWSTSTLREKLMFREIPRYIIYDKYGKVAYLNAPKPDLMGEVLDELLVN